MQIETPPAKNCIWQGMKIRLRPFTGKDAGVMSEADLESESVRLYEGEIPPLRTTEMMEDFIKHEISQPAENRFSFAVETLDGEMAGDANIRDWNNRNGTFSFGIRIYHEYQRKGYATEALRLILRYGFYELRCQKVNSNLLETNEASIRLHQAFGFIEEGRIRRGAYTDGKYLDKILFGLTREEFEEYELRNKH